jgi:hypothetical protein
MDIDGGQKAGEMVDESGQEIKLALEQPMGDAVEADRPKSRIKKDFPPRTRGGIPRLDRFQIGYQTRPSLRQIGKIGTVPGKCQRTTKFSVLAIPSCLVGVSPSKAGVMSAEGRKRGNE